MRTDLYYKPTREKVTHVKVKFCLSIEGMVMLMKSNLTKNDIDLLFAIIQCYEQRSFTLRDVRKHLFNITGKSNRTTKYSTKALIDSGFIEPLIGNGYTYRINLSIIYGLF
jgi:hypothetical protein